LWITVKFSSTNSYSINDCFHSFYAFIKCFLN
jgi:hypothetical protein